MGKDKQIGIEIKVNADTKEAEEKLLKIKNILLDIQKLLEDIGDKNMESIKELREELNATIDKGTKLDIALRTEEGLTADELGLMYAQLFNLSAYADILERRLELAFDMAKETADK